MTHAARKGNLQKLTESNLVGSYIPISDWLVNK